MLLIVETLTNGKSLRIGLNKLDLGTPVRLAGG